MMRDDLRWHAEGQWVEVGLIWGAAVKGCVRSSCVVEGDVAANRLPCFADAVIGVQIDFFVLDGSPEALDEDIVSPRALAVYADRDAVVDQHAGEIGTGELAALIGVEDLRAAVFCNGLLDSIDAERSLHRVRQPPGQDASREPVHHGRELNDATCTGEVGYVCGS